MSHHQRNEPEMQPSQRAGDLIIGGGMILTMAADEPPILEGEIHIHNGRIAGIKSVSEMTGSSRDETEYMDANDCIVMPGLINAHTHAAMTLFRGFADDLPLKAWLFEKIFPAEAEHLSPDTVYWGALLACLEMIGSGTTCFAEGYFFEDSTVRAVHEAGLRALIAQGIIDFPTPDVRDPKENLNVGRAFLQRWMDYSDLIIPGLFCHSPLTCSDDTLKGAWDICREFNVPLQIHLSETADEVDTVVKRSGKRPTRLLDDLGILGRKLIAAHAIHLDEEEMACIRKREVKVVHVPESNMKLGSGVARIPEMVEMGLTPGIGTDGCSSNNNLDMFQEMDTAAKLSKVSRLDPMGLEAKEVLKMATCWGAAVLGLEQDIGTLEVGKSADIIVVDTQAPHLCPLYDPYSALVYAANGADVRDVLVRGETLMRNRAFTRLDPDRIIRRVREISRGIHP